jgi:hypothetical protein
MTTQQSYDDALKQDLGALIDAIELPDLQKRFLRLRWLDQMLWAERRAGEARNRYYALRMLAIVGGVIVPALVSLNLQAAPVGWITFALSLAVAISLAVESFFRWGERWTHYRRMAELLKSEGWMFFQLAGPYREPGTHAAAYPEFAKRVEAVVASDVELFIAELTREKSERPKSADGEVSGKP